MSKNLIPVVWQYRNRDRDRDRKKRRWVDPVVDLVYSIDDDPVSDLEMEGDYRCTPSLTWSIFGVVGPGDFSRLTLKFALLRGLGNGVCAGWIIINKWPKKERGKRKKRRGRKIDFSALKPNISALHLPNQRTSPKIFCHCTVHFFKWSDLILIGRGRNIENVCSDTGSQGTADCELLQLLWLNYHVAHIHGNKDTYLLKTHEN